MSADLAPLRRYQLLSLRLATCEAHVPQSIRRTEMPECRRYSPGPNQLGWIRRPGLRFVSGRIGQEVREEGQSAKLSFLNNSIGFVRLALMQTTTLQACHSPDHAAWFLFFVVRYGVEAPGHRSKMLDINPPETGVVNVRKHAVR